MRFITFDFHLYGKPADGAPPSLPGRVEEIRAGPWALEWLVQKVFHVPVAVLCVYDSRRSYDGAME